MAMQMLNKQGLATRCIASHVSVALPMRGGMRRMRSSPGGVALSTANPWGIDQCSSVIGRLITCAAYAVDAGASQAEEEALATSCQVFVGNLSWNTTSDDLTSAFSSVPGLQSAFVMMRDGRSRGIGLVDYGSHEAAEQAVQQWDQQELDGRTINVRLSLPRSGREPRRRDGGDEQQARYRSDDGGQRAYDGARGTRVPREGREPRAPNPNAVLLFVGNLSYDTEWQEVKDHFASAGKVDFVKVKTTPEGRSRGFAVVQMSDEGSASAALSDLHNSELGGRQLLVRRYERREPQPGYGRE